MKSRFLNVSPRSYIRQKDSKNILPPIVRTGYQNETGEEISPFSENDNTIIFKDNSILLAPYMVSEHIAELSGFMTGNLVLTASIRDRSSYLDKNIENNPIVAFKENAGLAGYDPGQDLGFPGDVFPGFSSPDSDKMAIVFNIGSSNDFNAIKLKLSDSLADPAGPFYGESGSGFLYYDHSVNQWVDVGTRDPATGLFSDYNPVFDFDHAIAFPLVTGQNLIEAGAEEFLCQFSSSPYSITTEGPNYIPKSVSDLEKRGYDKIGEPTSFFGAPYSPRYHATSGSAIRLSQFISCPIVVDRITVKMPVRFYRTQDTPSLPGGGRDDDGFARDIDNHVFFVYVQNRSNAIKDSKQDVSSSVRYLIAKESFCAFNRPTLDKVRPGLLPLHRYSSASSFNLVPNIASGSKTAIESFIDVDLDMTFRPSTFDAYFGATSKLAGRSYTPAGPTTMTGSVFVQNFWRGGQYATGSESRIVIPDLGPGNVRNTNQRISNIPPNILDFTCTPSPRALVTSFWEGSSDVFTSGSGLGEPGIELNTATIDSIHKNTPVVLFPDDELIFGIDSGANSNMISPGRSNNGIDKSILSVTGSRLVIRSGDASVTIYGSPVSLGMESLPSLNQHLGSDAVSEDIHEAGPFDQFDILSPIILSASYVDGVFEGSALSGTRERVSLASQGEAWITGSLQRNVRHNVTDLVFFDTFFPPGESIASGIQNATFEISPKNRPAVTITRSTTNGYAYDNNRAIDTLLERSFTYEKDETSSRLRSVDLVLRSAGGSFMSSHSEDSARFILYYNGYNPNTDVQVALSQKKYSGAASIRYGMQNVRITGPSAVFRRDHYGYFRDMLEQPRDGRFISSESGKDVLKSSVVIAQFVSGSSDTIVEPESTQCSNLSQFCTSSIPYCDNGTETNRGPLPMIQSGQFGPNNLVFGVTKDVSLGSSSTLSLIG